jgi:hypothetical protein
MVKKHTLPVPWRVIESEARLDRRHFAGIQTIVSM